MPSPHKSRGWSGTTSFWTALVFRKYYSGSGGEGRLFDSPPDSYQLTVYDGAFSTPDWFSHGIVYQIFPDRFCRPDGFLGLAEHRALGHRVLLHEDWNEPVRSLPPEGEKEYCPCDFYGGNLWGVREKLPFLQELGVKCIYLNPIFLSNSNHRYNTMDYLRVDPMLGGDEALRALAAEAKRRGIKLMLDGVFSHTGDDSLYFDRKGIHGGACGDSESPYREWYDFQEYPGSYRCWWGFQSLPEVKELTPSYMEFIGRVLEHYAQMGITSWRLDVADELPDEFIAFLRKKLKSLDLQGVLVGEVWEDASNKRSPNRRKYVDGRELDSVTGYPFREAVLDFLMFRTGAQGFCDELWQRMENYPAPFCRANLNLLGSHDTARILSALGGAPPRDTLTREEQARFHLSGPARKLAVQRLKAAAALQFILPGVPCVYYGDEAGAVGTEDPFNRGPYPWGREDGEILPHYRMLGALRRCSAVQKGGLGLAAVGEDVAVLLRRQGNQGILLAVNRRESACDVCISEAMFRSGPDERTLWRDGVFREVAGGREYRAAGGKMELSLPGMGCIILIME